jgi:hypothetical protein
MAGRTTENRGILKYNIFRMDKLLEKIEESTYKNCVNRFHINYP